MKKILSALVLILVLASCAFAQEGDLKIGILSKLNITEEDFRAMIASDRETGATKMFSLVGNLRDVTFVFYDSLTALLLALNKGEVNEIALPSAVAEYVLNTNSDYEISTITRGGKTYLSFGFRASDDPELRNKFNDALLSMSADGTLAILISKLIVEPGLDIPDTIKFFKYNNAETVKVAVTGDLPPIDYVAPDGKAAGFNVAILAEIARRLHINVELVNIDSAARAASLASGRSDVVFWFESTDGVKGVDVPDGVALSEPYYNWNETLHLKKK